LQSIAEALEIFDQIRSPYYLKMYNHLDEMKRFMEEAKKAPKASFEDALRVRVSSFGGDENCRGSMGMISRRSGRSM
jgi:salicylate hydroxylase